MSTYAYNYTGLNATLHGRFVDWRDQRKPQENMMFDCYQDLMRISRDDEGKDSGLARAQKSRLFIGSTRGKIRSAKAKIKDVLFSGGQLPFDTEPSSEDLKQFADTFEKILTCQLKDMDFESLLDVGTSSLCTYGTGFIFGPFIRQGSTTYVQPVSTQQGQELQQQEHFYPCPYFEHARTMDVYPDPEAEDVTEGRGIFWAAKKQKEFILSLKGQPGFWDEAVEHAYTSTVQTYTSDGSDRTDMARRNLYRYEKDGRVWYYRYFGSVLRKEFIKWKREAGQISDDEAAQFDGMDDRETVEVVAILGGGIVLKVEESPYKRRPAYRSVYELVEHEMWGIGIAQNNDPHQKVINAAFRAFVENKGFALNPPRSIDRSKFKATEDFKYYPGKLYDMQDGLTPDERNSAMILHAVPDTSDGWMKLIEVSEQFSDDDTAVTKYTQGDDSPHLNKTATGISMIMNAASLPLKEVIGNIDRMWIEPMVEALIDWDLKYLQPQTVEVLVGKKEAVIWDAIQKFGRTTFMRWFATGAKTFMMREVLMQKLQGYLQLVLSGGQATLPLVDVRELLEQVWRAGSVGLESPVMSDDNKTQQAVNAVKQQLVPVIQGLQQQVAALKSDKVIELAKYTNDAQKTGAAIEQTHAEIDLIEAQTVATLMNAGVQPDGSLLREAVTIDDAGTRSTTGSAPRAGANADRSMASLATGTGGP